MLVYKKAMEDPETTCETNDDVDVVLYHNLTDNLSLSYGRFMSDRWTEKTDAARQSEMEERIALWNTRMANEASRLGEENVALSEEVAKLAAQ